MISVAQRTSYPVIPAPRNRFSALTISDAPGHLSGIDTQLRSLGATSVAASDHVRDDVAPPTSVSDLCVVDGSAPDLLGELAALRTAGWRRIVVVMPNAEADTVRHLIGHGARSMVVAPAAPETQPRPAPRQATTRGMAATLSEREIQVLQRVAEGHSNREIGQDLCLSALTVKSHLARISRKLGTGDRAEMVAIAFRGGLVH